jgi:hypothetical protein
MYFLQLSSSQVPHKAGAHQKKESRNEKKMALCKKGGEAYEGK